LKIDKLVTSGKIRLGLKIPNKGMNPEKCSCQGAGCFKCCHPQEVDYFVIPDKLKKFYGEKPKQLDVMLPNAPIEKILPHSYQFWGKGGIKCEGNLEGANYYDEASKSWLQIQCPCDKKDKDCFRRGNLFVICWRYNIGEVFQIPFGSFSSITNILSGLDNITGIVGRYSMIPLILSREKTTITYEGTVRFHYPMQIKINVNDPETIKEWQKMTGIITHDEKHLLEAPVDESPDEGTIVTEWKEETGAEGSVSSEGENGGPGADSAASPPIPVAEPIVETTPCPMSIHDVIKSISYREAKGEDIVYKIVTRNGHFFQTLDKNLAIEAKKLKDKYAYIDYYERPTGKWMDAIREEANKITLKEEYEEEVPF
jgi:hypothetical protein